MRRRVVALAAALAFSVWTRAAAEEDGGFLPLEASVALARDFVARGEKAWERIATYRATLYCRERHKGKPRDAEMIQQLFKKPGSVRLEWIAPGPFAGLLASYVPERDGPDHCMVIGEGALRKLGVLRLENRGRIARTIYPHHFVARDTHVGFILADSRATLERAAAIGRFRMRRPEMAESEILGRTMQRTEVRLSDRPEDGLPYARAVFYYDPDHEGLPLHVELYDFDGGVRGIYAYRDFTPNVPVADDAFDLKKP